MRFIAWTLAIAAAAAIPASAQAPAQLQPNLKPTASVGSSAVPSTAATQTAAPALTKADADAWLDGFLPYAIKRAGIPGAVVVVVKDGQPLTERGYGFADVKAHRLVDPKTTMFRPGSVTKTLTWTAVMQQVQAGKINLDANVNTYLDFKIPPAFGKPITVRNLMTHTAGFAETAKFLLNYSGKAPLPLDRVLRRSLPDRIYAPGTMPAYSNYGASLAGYIVQRVSGEPFDTYIQRHILAPLQMNHSTFDQPVPAALAPYLAKGYVAGSDDPKGFEVIDLAPAGSLSASGDDMGKFMIAHLANGGPLLNPATAKLMHGIGNKPFSALPAMALGFYHEDRNGLNIIGHGGDTDLFHSDLHLFLDKNVGIFISLNSLGKDGAAHDLREQWFKAFTDRYFPHPSTMLPTTSTAADHAKAMAGHYVSSRASGFSWLRMVSLLGETKVAAAKDNTISVSSLLDSSGTPKRWREVGPYLWQEVNGTDLLQANVDSDGRIKMFSIAGFAPIFEFLPAPASLNAGWILPVAGLAFLIMLIAAVGWPTVALVRRRYKYNDDMSGRDLQLHRAVRATAWLFLLFAAGWLVLFKGISSDVSLLDARLDVWMRLLQLILIVTIFGTLAAIWNAYRVARASGRHWFTTTWAILIALAAAFLIWLSIDAGLLTASLNY